MGRLFFLPALIGLAFLIGLTGCNREPGDVDFVSPDGGASDRGVGTPDACGPGEIWNDIEQRCVPEPPAICVPGCADGEICVDGACVDEDAACEPDANGQLQVDICECITCPNGETCVSGVGCQPEPDTGEDECLNDEDCPEGFSCDTASDPNVCREGDGTCNEDCPDGQLCVDGECLPFCTEELRQNDPIQFRDRCCDNAGEFCCECGDPVQQGNCDQREELNLCPPDVECDCDFRETCSDAEWQICQERRNVCDCTDPVLAGNCPDAAACQCVCDDPVYGRFCDTPAEQQVCEPDPNPEACDCEDPATWRLCGDDDDNDTVPNACDDRCDYQLSAVRMGDTGVGFVLKASDGGAIGPACASHLGAENWSGETDPGNPSAVRCTGDRPGWMGWFCDHLANDWGYVSRWVRGTLSPDTGWVTIPLAANECLAGGGQGGLVAYANATLVTAGEGWQACGDTVDTVNLNPLSDAIRLGNGIKVCHRPGDDNAYLTVGGTAIDCLPGHVEAHNGGVPR